MPTWPSALPCKDLADSRPGYLLSQLSASRDLYEGGRRFRENIEHYLDKREIEKAASGPSRTAKLDQENAQGAEQWAGRVNIGSSQWNARKAVSRYANHVAGMIDHVVASVLKFRPEIEGPGPYWAAMNSDCDGNGLDFVAHLRRLAIEVLVTGCPFVGLVGKNVIAENRYQFEKLGGQDLKLSIIRREAVTDSDFDGDVLGMAKTYRRETIRANPWENPNAYRHTWCFYDAKEIAEYSITHPASDGPMSKHDAKADLTAIRTHGIDGMPMVPVSIMDGLWAMDRLMDPTLALFNIEASLNWSLWQHAHPIPVIETDRTDLSDMLISDMTALKFRIGEKLIFAGATALNFTAIAEERQQKKRDLYEVFQSMATQAAALAIQNPRQAAQAKEMDREPFSLLLQTVADGLRESEEKALRKIAIYRGEDPAAVKVSGLDGYGPDDGDELKENLQPEKLHDPVADAQEKALAAMQLGLAAERADGQGDGKLAAKLRAVMGRITDGIEDGV